MTNYGAVPFWTLLPHSDETHLWAATDTNTQRSSSWQITHRYWKSYKPDAVFSQSWNVVAVFDIGP